MGKLSMLGATWRDAYGNTVNGGFASGTPRCENRTGVRKGRTGKAPAKAPNSMLRALGVEVKHGDSQDNVEAKEDDGHEGSGIKKNYHYKGVPRGAETDDKGQPDSRGSHKWQRRLHG